jgi:hypothetical protein
MVPDSSQTHVRFSHLEVHAVTQFTRFAAVVLVICTATTLALAQDQEDAPALPADGDREEVLLDDRDEGQPAAADKRNGADDPATRAMLDRALPEVTFDGVGLSDVIDFLRDVTNANIFVNWRALEGAGIDRGATVNVRLRDVKFSKALQIILDGVGGDEVRLGYTVGDGVVTISTEAPAPHTRAYDVRDILQAKGAAAAAAAPADPAKRLATLQKLVTGSVAPRSWNAGAYLRAKPDEGVLVITQTPANHDAVANLLKQTRALMGLPPAEDPAPVIAGPKE